MEDFLVIVCGDFDNKIIGEDKIVFIFKKMFIKIIRLYEKLMYFFLELYVYVYLWFEC